MANEQRIATAQAEGNSTGIAIPNHANTTKSHLRTLLVGGTFGGATVKYQVSLDDTTYFDVDGADAITAATAINVEHRCPYHRINVGVGTAESIDAWVV